MSDDEKVTNIEWLARSLSIKPQNYAVGGGGGLPDIDWTDKCGVFQKLPGEHVKAFACLMAWGDLRDGDAHFKRVVNYLVQITLAACSKKKVQLRDNKHTLPDFIERIAQLVVYMQLRPVLQKVYPTIFGRLYFAGIEISDDAYRKTWRVYEESMTEILGKWEAEIDSIIGEYRRQLKNEQD